MYGGYITYTDGEFLLTRLMRGVTCLFQRIVLCGGFLLTRLMRGVTAAAMEHPMVKAFLLTRLMRGVTKGHLLPCHCCKFLLTRLMRGVTKRLVNIDNNTEISTHTPHARRDVYSDI